MSYSLAFSQAIVAVTYIADKVQQGFFEFTPTTQLAEDLNIARPSAGKIIQNLTQAGIIETREGAKGGVRLAKAAGEVTVLDIFYAIEGERPLFRSRFKFNVSGKKPTQVQKSLVDLLDNAEVAMKNELQGTTIADLIAKLYE